MVSSPLGSWNDDALCPELHKTARTSRCMVDAATGQFETELHQLLSCIRILAAEIVCGNVVINTASIEYKHFKMVDTVRFLHRAPYVNTAVTS